MTSILAQFRRFCAGAAIGTSVLLVTSLVSLHLNLGVWVPPCLSSLPSAWQLPHMPFAPLTVWLKLSLAYLTQAYVDFIPRQSEAGQAFKAGALLV